MLLANQATLLPSICANFTQHVTELVAQKGIQEPPELKLINSRWIMCELTAKYQHHISYTCNFPKYGTLVYRPTCDIHALLSEALWKLKYINTENALCHTLKMRGFLFSYKNYTSNLYQTNTKRTGS